MALRIGTPISQYGVEGGCLKEFRDWLFLWKVVGLKQKLIGDMYELYSDEDIIHWYKWLQFNEPDLNRVNVVKLFQGLTTHNLLFVGITRDRVREYIKLQPRGTGAIMLSDNKPQRFVLILKRESNVSEISFGYDSSSSKIITEKCVPFYTRTIGEMNWGMSNSRVPTGNFVETWSNFTTVERLTGDASLSFKLTLIETGFEFENIMLTSNSKLSLIENSRCTLPFGSERLSLSLQITHEGFKSKLIPISMTTTFRFSRSISTEYNIHPDRITPNTILYMCNWITSDCQSLLLTTGQTTSDMSCNTNTPELQELYEQPDAI
jgi:hypothetical protein